ncbi:MAG: ABC transporter permease [Deltaproteobacteria bacterium]|nr:ABC transporter permease [Deltaproteobacteria bacterium]
MTEQAARSPLWRRLPELVGAASFAGLDAVYSSIAYVGAFARLVGAALDRTMRAITRTGQPIRLYHLVEQSIRVGVKAIPIVMLVQVFIGLILALNMAPTLQSYGQLERTADVVAVAILRELGPLITAVLLSGFAGASIAAELGTMVEGEEIKALRAEAIDPIRFLVVPRMFATSVMMVGLAIIADIMGVLGGLFTGTLILGLNARAYLEETRSAILLSDYFTGLLKSLVFGVIIAGLACHEGLSVKGGAEGVGRATTTTVVKCIVLLIVADSIFAAVFYTLGW